MSERPGSDKPVKKDQKGPREAREELNEVIGSRDSKPLVRKPNRDVARGDWDRSGDHHDENNTVDE